MIEVKNKTLFELIKEVTNKYNDTTALISGKNNISYNELLKNINIISDAFMEIGLSNLDKVNVLSYNCLEIVYTLFALNKIGANINIINYDMDCESIINNIDDNILIIDKLNYDKYITDIKNKDIKKIIIIDDIEYDNDDVISWKHFITLSKYYNKTIKRKYNSKFISLTNTYKRENDLIKINVSEETINNSITNILNLNLFKEGNIVLNVNPLYDYIGYNLSLIIPLLSGNTVILDDMCNISDVICSNKIDYIIGNRCLFERIIKIDKNKLENLKLALMVCDIINEHSDELINKYFDEFKNTELYRAFGIREVNNIITLSSDNSLGNSISCEIAIYDCINNKKINDDSIGSIWVKNDSICQIINDNKELKPNKDGYINTNFAGNIKDNKLYIVDTLEKEAERIKIAKTHLASIDMPWLKFFPEESKHEKVLPLTLYQNLKEANKDNYTNVALTYMGEEIKFYQLFNNIEKMAKSLTALGVKKGDYVTFCMPNMPEFVYIFYAVNKIGAISFLIEPRTPASKIKDSLEESGSKYLFMIDLCKKNIDKIIDMEQLKHVVSISAVECLSDKKTKKIYQLAHKPVKTNGKYINYKDFVDMGNSFDNIKTVDYKPNTIATVINTSGTTGKPKGAQLPNETYNGQNMQLKYSGICPKPGEIFLGNIPFFSAYGSSSGMHNALCSGVTIALIPSYKYDDFPKLIKKHKPTHVMGVPRFYELLAESKIFKDEDLSYVKNLVSGGDKMTPSREYYVNEKLSNLNCGNLKKGLGMSEFGGGFITTVNDYVNKVGSVGIPHVGNNVKIVDPDTKEELKYGRDHNVGELYVTAPTMMIGYLNREKENNEFFEIDENGVRWAKTGDLVYMDEDGVIFFMDRMKNVIMRPEGLTVPLLPIENVIDKSEYVESCAVVGVNEKENQTGKYPMAFIVLKKDKDKSVNQIHNEILKQMDLLIPTRKQPKWYRYVDEIPYNLGGKVNLKKLEEIGNNDKNKNASFVNLEKNNEKE